MSEFGDVLEFESGGRWRLDIDLFLENPEYKRLFRDRWHNELSTIN